MATLRLISSAAGRVGLVGARSPYGRTKLHLRQDLHLARKAWHMSMGLMIAGIYGLTGIWKSTALSLLGFFLVLDLLMETARLRFPSINEKVMKMWGPLMRSCEVDRFSGTPYYLFSVMLAIAVFPKTVAVLSILYLAVGDPVASLCGILWGDRSYRFKSGKSLIGTLGGVVACTLVGFFVLQPLSLPFAHYVFLSIAGGIAGGTAEMLPLDVDDNLSIPMVSGFLTWLAFLFVGT